jgi:hypothetical protein
MLSRRSAERLRKHAAKLLKARPTASTEKIARESISAVISRRIPVSIPASDLETLALIDRVLSIVHDERAAMREVEIERIAKAKRRTAVEEIRLVLRG